MGSRRLVIMENKQSNKKTPTVRMWIAFGFFLVMLFGVFHTINSEVIKPSSIEQASKEEKKEEAKARAQDFWDKGEKLNKEVGDIFVEGDTVFIKTHLENMDNTYISLELTVSDKWYYLPEFEQERLLEDAWQIFNSLTVKYGLRNEDDMPWKVIFLDHYEKKVAEKGW